MNFNHIPHDNHARYSPALHVAAAWQRESAPPQGTPVFILAMDDRGEYQVPFPVIFTEFNVSNTKTGKSLADEFQIVGWRHR